MKYPVVLLFRQDKYKHIDQFIEGNIPSFECSFVISGEVADLNKLFDNTCHILATYGDDVREYLPIVEPHIVRRINYRWVHYQTLTTEQIPAFNQGIQYCFIDNVLKPREQTRPMFSIITPAYNSYQKILRAYRSLLAQTLRDWEWIIVDDSPTDDHFSFLRANVSSLQNHKIRLYRRDQNSGSIGNVKNEAASLARGKYVLELDHDDEIIPDCLANAAQVFESDPAIGFVYMDFINIFENGDNFKYSDFISFGYGGYYSQKHRGIWRYVYITPNVNNITASALISLPNHPRIWRRDVLLRAGNYSEMLPICDDMEILLNTFANTDVKVAKIHKMGYIQYMNEGNNNFSLIRNADINRLGPMYIYPQFYRKHRVHAKFAEAGAYEDEENLRVHRQLWKRPPEYTHKYINIITNPDYECQVCILGRNAFTQHRDRLREMNAASPSPSSSPSPHRKYDFILLDNDGEINDLWTLLDAHGYDHWKCYVLPNTTTDELLHYFHRLYRSSTSYIILEPSDNPNATHLIPIEIDDHSNSRYTSAPYNTEYATRHELINAHTEPTQSYLEIGVEYGQTFFGVHFATKTGVDPSHKIPDGHPASSQIQKKTSDEFFAQMDKFRELFAARKNHYIAPNAFVPRIRATYDVIFIDGMHQTEYVLRDVNNAVKYLSPQGRIFIDDILPICENEQQKIPDKHVIEDGVMKYVEAWTGDVWKLVYYLLKNHRTQFKYKWFNHPNYRGVIMLYDIVYFKIDNSATTLEAINGADYVSEFGDYLAFLCRC